MFHLFTHAFFKALLFLGAGSVMHAMGNVIDMRRFSGLRKVLPIHALDVPVRRAGPGRLPAVVGLLEQGRDSRRRLDRRPSRRPIRGLLSLPLARRADHGGPDGVLHVPGLLPDILGRGTHSARGVRASSRPCRARRIAPPGIAAGDDHSLDDSRRLRRGRRFRAGTDSPVRTFRRPYAWPAAARRRAAAITP